MTVYELKKALKDAPDDYEVRYFDKDEGLACELKSIQISICEEFDYGIGDDTSLPLKLVLLV